MWFKTLSKITVALSLCTMWHMTSSTWFAHVCALATWVVVLRRWPKIAPFNVVTIFIVVVKMSVIWLYYTCIPQQQPTLAVHLLLTKSAAYYHAIIHITIIMKTTAILWKMSDSHSTPWQPLFQCFHGLLWLPDQCLNIVINTLAAWCAFH